MMPAIRKFWAGIRRYPSVVVSAAIIAALVGISIYAVFSLPLSEAVRVWNSRGEQRTYTPLAAQPAWTNLFRQEKLPKTSIVRVDDFESSVDVLGESAWQETTLLTFDYDHSRLPSEIAFLFDIRYGTKRPLVTVTWIRPDGIEIELYHGAAVGGGGRLDIDPAEAMGPTTGDVPEAVAGSYALRIGALIFEEEGVSVGGEIVIYGRVYGIAGTDDQRRNLAIGLMWGTPIALMIGLFAATGTTVFGFIIAAVGAWFGGWVDATIQRITEVSMMIPFLPTILMVGWYFSKSIWVLLIFIVGFSLFSGPVKTYRAMFLQVIHSQYIEAARTYGASNARIIFRYLIPHMAPAVLPRLILGVPLFVYLEASLAFLDIADPFLPTWGKILSAARQALYMGHYHWMAGPAFMLLITGLAFSMLGYTLDRILNPRLRDM